MAQKLKLRSERRQVMSTFLTNVHCAETSMLFHFPTVQLLKCNVERITQAFFSFQLVRSYLLHGGLTHNTIRVYPAQGVMPSRGAVNREDHHETVVSSWTTISVKELKSLQLKARQTLGIVRIEKDQEVLILNSSISPSEVE